jgi:hypothetical protein
MSSPRVLLCALVAAVAVSLSRSLGSWALVFSLQLTLRSTPGMWLRWVLFVDLRLHPFRTKREAGRCGGVCKVAPEKLVFW